MEINILWINLFPITCTEEIEYSQQHFDRECWLTRLRVSPKHDLFFVVHQHTLKTLDAICLVMLPFDFVFIQDQEIFCIIKKTFIPAWRTYFPNLSHPFSKQVLRVKFSYGIFVFIPHLAFWKDSIQEAVFACYIVGVCFKILWPDSTYI